MGNTANMTRETALASVRSFLKGSKLVKFDESVRVWEASLAQGSWIKRGHASADSAFYGGLLTRAQRVKLGGWLAGGQQERCISYGYGFDGDFVNVTGVENVKGLSLEVLRAWGFLCVLKSSEFEALKLARPRPVITPIGASPRVTATLKECNLNVDLATIKPAEIEAFKVQLRNKKHELVFDRDGSPVLVTAYRVKWSAGIALRVSRFQGGQHCELCGKFIPSCTFVAMEMTDKHTSGDRLIGMWVGRDCASTLLGVEDVGIVREAE